MMELRQLQMDELSHPETWETGNGPYNDDCGCGIW